MLLVFSLMFRIAELEVFFFNYRKKYLVFELNVTLKKCNIFVWFHHRNILIIFRRGSDIYPVKTVVMFCNLMFFHIFLVRMVEMFHCALLC